MCAERARDGCARLSVRDVHRLRRIAHYSPPPFPRLEAGTRLDSRLPIASCIYSLTCTPPPCPPVHHRVSFFLPLIVFILSLFTLSHYYLLCFPIHSVRATLRYHLRTERIARMGQLFGFVCLNTRGDAGRGAHVHNLVRQRELYEGRR
jgi:hypothetical protein